MTGIEIFVVGLIIGWFIYHTTTRTLSPIMVEDRGPPEPKETKDET